MPDNSNTSNQQVNKTLIKAKLGEERREGHKVEQRIKEEERTRNDNSSS